jgi:hypothetical protein
VSAAAHWSSRTPRFRLTAPELLEVDIHQACAEALDKLLLPPAVSSPQGTRDSISRSPK